MPSFDPALVLRAFERYTPIGPAAWADVRPLLVPRSFARGAWLLSAGDRAEWCFLLCAGLVRELYVDEEGTEQTRRFLAEGHVTGSLLDLLSGEPSITWIQALEPTRTLAWRFADLDALSRRHPDLQALFRRSAEGLAVWKTRREHELLALPAAERLRRWRAEQPDLDGRVTRRHLASYLGVTPEHLSRLQRARRPAPARRTARR